MFINFYQFGFLLIGTFFGGAFFTYLFFKVKHHLLKEELVAKNLSLKSMWGNNDAWKKKYQLLQEENTRLAEGTKQPIPLKGIEPQKNKTSTKAI